MKINSLLDLGFNNTPKKEIYNIIILTNNLNEKIKLLFTKSQTKSQAEKFNILNNILMSSSNILFLANQTNDFINNLIKIKTAIKELSIMQNSSLYTEEFKI